MAFLAPTAVPLHGAAALSSSTSPSHARSARAPRPRRGPSMKKPSDANANANGNGATSTSQTPSSSANANVPDSALGTVIAIGLSHNTATVEVREKLAVPEPQWAEAAAALVECQAVAEAAVLSTCNRFEVYVVAEGGATFAAIHQVMEFLSRRSGVDVRELRPCMFMLTEDEAVAHLLRVSAGLDSLVVGEGQILSQVKRCYEVATDKEGSAGKILNRFLNVAVSAGKRVRAETGIAKGAVSISSAAVELAEIKTVTDVEKPLVEAKTVILGAGKMARLLVQHLASRGVSDIAIVNRSAERAEELAKMFPETGLKLLGMDQMLDAVASADLVFASTGAQEPILYKDNLGPAVAAGSRSVLIDISVPRNIDANVSEIDGVMSYNVDDLKAVVAKNQARRRRLMLEAEDLLKEEQALFNNWHHSLGCVPAITKLQERAEQIRRDEVDKMRKKLSNLEPSEIEAVERITKGIINKMLHGPMSHLRGLSDMEERSQTLRNLEALFKL